MIVVADTSPILNLYRVGLEGLLPKIYGEILIPPVVVNELRENGVELEEDHCFLIQTANESVLASELSKDLDPGETAAIALAVERKAEWILIDERRGRRRAEECGLVVVGLLGILKEAKRREIIPACRPWLAALRKDAGFWVADSLVERFLGELGE